MTATATQTRTCAGCNEVRDSETDFYNKRSRCKECIKKAARDRRGPRTCVGCASTFHFIGSVGTRRLTCDTCAETVKWCKRCEAVKPYSDFYKTGGRWQAYCKTCCLAENRKRLYGFTAEDAERFGNQCGICGTTENLVVDHCHDTGAIRGLLCGLHNSGLGMFQDNLEHLEAAMTYLRNHRAGGQ